LSHAQALLNKTPAIRKSEFEPQRHQEHRDHPISDLCVLSASVVGSYSLFHTSAQRSSVTAVP
jgi:hypothetical protein